MATKLEGGKASVAGPLQKTLLFLRLPLIIYKEQGISIQFVHARMRSSIKFIYFDLFKAIDLIYIIIAHVTVKN